MGGEGGAFRFKVERLISKNRYLSPTVFLSFFLSCSKTASLGDEEITHSGTQRKAEGGTQEAEAPTSDVFDEMKEPGFGNVGFQPVDIASSSRLVTGLSKAHCHPRRHVCKAAPDSLWSQSGLM